MNPLLLRIIDMLVQDLYRPGPLLTHTIFSCKELKKFTGEDIPDPIYEKIIEDLEDLDIIRKINHFGPDGQYYNITYYFYFNFGPKYRHSIKRIIKTTEKYNKSFCLTKGQESTYHLLCKGEKCKFFFPSLGKCIEGKIFVKSK